MLHTAAYIALVTLFALSLFQLALLFGTPLGKYAWGGSNKVLPVKFRIASVASIFLYILFAIFLLSKSGILITISNQQILDVCMWVFSIYFLIGSFMNAMSRSKPERNVMTPVAAILTLSFLYVTLS